MENWSNYSKDGMIACGKYLGQFPFSGIITESRVKYGGKVQYTVSLHNPIEVYGRIADIILIDEGSDVVIKPMSEFFGNLLIKKA